MVSVECQTDIPEVVEIDRIQRKALAIIDAKHQSPLWGVMPRISELPTDVTLDNTLDRGFELSLD